jgi:hypothetical protein
MVRKPNYEYSNQDQQQPSFNMQYPPAAQGPPYNDDSKPLPPNLNQSQQNQSSYPYTAQSPPPVTGPYGAAYGESQGYYRPPYQPTYPEQPYQSQSYAPGPYANQSYGSPQQYGQQYPPQQYPQHYQPPVEAPYASPPPSNATHYSGSPHGDQPPTYTAGYQPPAGAPPQADEERGIMGALAGGAAGGYAGHKMHHGFLGTIDGAYAGHKLEDKYKEHHNKPPPSPTHQKPPPVPMTSRPHGNGHKMGNFSASAHNTTLDGDFDLIAECTAIDGKKKLSSISLNQLLTNDDGHFQWVPAGGNFAGSARNINLVDGGAFLEAELRACDGRWVRDRICLDERIENSDGDLKFV